MIGSRYGRLIVLAKEKIVGRNYYYLCKCDCGNQKVIYRGSLIAGKTKSCGCLNSEMSRTRRKSHACSSSRTYNIWVNIKARCLNSSNPAFIDYGGRGITVCESWTNSFESFLADMGECPNGKSIERIDNEQGYSINNCRWATAKEQANNRRSNIKIEHKGKIMTVMEWSELLGIPYFTLLSRLKNPQWDIERSFQTKEEKAA